jgi:hypothetical protein
MNIRAEIISKAIEIGVGQPNSDKYVWTLRFIRDAAQEVGGKGYLSSLNHGGMMALVHEVHDAIEERKAEIEDLQDKFFGMNRGGY